MGEGDALRLPRKDRADSGPRFSPLQEHRQSHAEEDLAPWIVHSGHPSGEPPGLCQLVELKVDDGVGEHERLCALVKENNLSEDAARDGGLVDIVAPLFRRGRAQVPLELDVDAASPSPASYARR